MKAKKQRLLAYMLATLFILAALLGLGPAIKAEENISDKIVRTTEDWPTYYDPGVGSDYSSSTTQANVYDPLLFPVPDGSIKPHIATEWNISDDSLTYTFKIRNDVKFHSGEFLSADDVEYSMKRMLDLGEGYAYIFQNVIESVTAIDKETVEFKLNKPFGPFLFALVRLMIVDKKTVEAHYDTSVDTYGEKGDYGKTWLLTHDAGSGPYETAEFKLDEYFLGKKFDDYFLGWKGDEPEYFKISNMTEPVAVRTAVANKELEITDELQPLENYNTMAEMDGIGLATWLSGNTFQMMLNTKAEFTDDVHLRKAIALCFDYETVVTQIYPGAKISQGPVAVVLPGFESEIPESKQDIEKAKEELAQSKYAGQEINLNLSWCAEVPEQEKISLLLQSNLAELGIGLQITKKPFGAMIADAQNVETTPQISFVNFSSPYFEAGGQLRTRYHSSATGTWEQMEWLQDPELDKMIDEALATIDEEKRFKMYSEIQKYIYDIQPTVWVFNWIEKRAVNKDKIEWPAYTAMEKEENFFMPMGFSIYCHDMRIK